MTLPSRVLACFPTAHLAAALAAGGWLIVAPGVGPAASVVLVTYALPVVVFRLLGRLAPLAEGISRLDGPRYSPWWGGHQVQALFLAVPALEAVLRLVPGLFSLWLRAWGSRIGRGVYWTPRLEVADRSLLEVGDRVVFGQGVSLYAHVVTPRPDRLVLYVRRITIGAGAFVGAGTRVGPGVRIDPGVMVPLLSDLYPNRHLGPGDGTGEEAAGPRGSRARGPVARAAPAAR